VFVFAAPQDRNFEVRFAQKVVAKQHYLYHECLQIPAGSAGKAWPRVGSAQKAGSTTNNTRKKTEKQ
jgi:hypothetical protein